MDADVCGCVCFQAAPHANTQHIQAANNDGLMDGNGMRSNGKQSRKRKRKHTAFVAISFVFVCSSTFRDGHISNKRSNRFSYRRRAGCSRAPKQSFGVVIAHICPFVLQRRIGFRGRCKNVLMSLESYFCFRLLCFHSLSLSIILDFHAILCVRHKLKLLAKHTKENGQKF